jgi:hypothetical protein
MNPLATLREMLDFMCRCAAESGHGFSEDLAGELEKQIRRKYSGDKIYIPAPSTAKKQAIKEAARRLPASVIVSRYGVSRQWVNRIIKK